MHWMKLHELHEFILLEFRPKLPMISSQRNLKVNLVKKLSLLQVLVMDDKRKRRRKRRSRRRRRSVFNNANGDLRSWKTVLKE